MRDFFQSTTLVPILGIPDVDARIKKVMEDQWTFTKFQFVPYEDLDRVAEEGDEKSTSKISIDTYYFDGTFVTTCLNVAMPGNPQFTRMRNVIASVPLNCGQLNRKQFGDACSYEANAYKMDIMILQLMEIITFVREQAYKPRQAHLSGVQKYVSKFNEWVQANPPQTEKKPLLVSQAFFTDKFSSGDFDKWYKGPIKFVSQEEYERIIKERSLAYYYLFFGQDPRVILSVFDPESQRTLFLDSNYAKSTTFGKMVRMSAAQIKRLQAQLGSL
ncbi:MAG: hypothetical protein AAFR61_20750 [Bacteroidota bacterium]